MAQTDERDHHSILHTSTPIPSSQTIFDANKSTNRHVTRVFPAFYEQEVHYLPVRQIYKLILAETFHVHLQGPS